MFWMMSGYLTWSITCIPGSCCKHLRFFMWSVVLLWDKNLIQGTDPTECLLGTHCIVTMTWEASVLHQPAT